MLRTCTAGGLMLILFEGFRWFPQAVNLPLANFCLHGTHVTVISESVFLEVLDGFRGWDVFSYVSCAFGNPHKLLTATGKSV